MVMPRKQPTPFYAGSPDPHALRAAQVRRSPRSPGSTRAGAASAGLRAPPAPAAASVCLHLSGLQSGGGSRRAPRRCSVRGAVTCVLPGPGARGLGEDAGVTLRSASREKAAGPFFRCSHEAAGGRLRGGGGRRRSWSRRPPGDNGDGGAAAAGRQPGSASRGSIFPAPSASCGGARHRGAQGTAEDASGRGGCAMPPAGPGKSRDASRPSARIPAAPRASLPESPQAAAPLSASVGKHRDSPMVPRERPRDVTAGGGCEGAAPALHKGGGRRRCAQLRGSAPSPRHVTHRGPRPARRRGLRRRDRPGPNRAEPVAARCPATSHGGTSGSV